MKLLLFACAIWTGTNIDPSDGINYQMSVHRQVNDPTIEAICEGKCTSIEIRTRHGTGKTLVRGFNDREKTDQFCTSDASSKDQRCKFQGQAKHSFFIELECVSNQGCRNVYLEIYVDGVVTFKSMVTTFHRLRAMDHKAMYTYKCDCWKLDSNKNKCVGGRVSTHSQEGFVSITGYTNVEKQDDFCTSDWPAWPFAGPRSPVKGPFEETCVETGKSKPQGGSSFWIEMACFNFYNTANGCPTIKLEFNKGYVYKCALEDK